MPELFKVSPDGNRIDKIGWVRRIVHNKQIDMMVINKLGDEVFSLGNVGFNKVLKCLWWLRVIVFEYVFSSLILMLKDVVLHFV